MSLHDDILIEIQAGKIPEEFKASDVKYNFCDKTGSYKVGDGLYKNSAILTTPSNLRIDADGYSCGNHVKNGAKPKYIRISTGLYRLNLEGINENISSTVIEDIKTKKTRFTVFNELAAKKLAFNEVHLKVFKSTIPTHKLGTWAGKNIRRYGEYLKSKGVSCDVDSLPDKTMSRDNVFEFISNEKNTTFNCCIVILAWGGIKYHHAVMAMNDWKNWESIAEKIRFFNISRSQSYELFDDLRSQKKLNGIGPAYFTKLIFFLSKKDSVDVDDRCRGYIMDQWTARSLNLLLDSHCIALSSTLNKNGKYQRTVKDSNNASIYEFFCKKIEELSSLIGYKESPEKAEEYLFSIGKGKGEWRNYIVTSDNVIY